MGAREFDWSMLRPLQTLQHVVVVMGHDAAAEAPRVTLLDHLALVTARRERAALAVLGNQHKQVGRGQRSVALYLGGDVGDHVAKLHAARALRGEALGKT